jgi:hypothetical protein
MAVQRVRGPGLLSYHCARPGVALYYAIEDVSRSLSGVLRLPLDLHHHKQSEYSIHLVGI